MAPDKSTIEELSLDEKYEWVDALLIAIHKEVAEMPLPDNERKLIKERLAEFQANPNQGRPWREVLSDLGMKS